MPLAGRARPVPDLRPAGRRCYEGRKGGSTSMTDLKTAIDQATASRHLGELRTLRQRYLDAVAAAPLTPSAIKPLVAAALTLLVGRIDQLLPAPRNEQAADPFDPEVTARRLLADAAHDFPFRSGVAPALYDLPVAVLVELVPLLLCSPTYFARPGDGTRWHAYLTTTLRHLARRTETLAEQSERDAFGQVVSPHLSVLPLYIVDEPLTEVERLRDIFGRMYMASVGGVMDWQPPPRADGRLRVGLIRNGLQPSAEMASLIKHFFPYDRDRIEFNLYYLHNSSAREGVDEFLARFDRVYDMKKIDFFQAVDYLRKEDLDVILFGKNFCHAHTFEFLLSLHRIARTQINFTLSPATSASRYVDVYLTAAENERRGGETDYFERLVTVPGSVNYYDSTPPRQRRRAGRHDPIRFVCGGSVVKLSPDFLATAAEILVACPQAELVLFPFNPFWGGEDNNIRDVFTEHVLRIMAWHGVTAERVKLVGPFPTQDDVSALLADCSIYLDPFPFTGAVSTWMALQVGLPVISLDGNQARCRQASPLLRRVGLGDAIARTPQQYRDIAVSWANDPDVLDGVLARLDPDRLSDGEEQLPAASWAAISALALPTPG